MRPTVALALPLVLLAARLPAQVPSSGLTPEQETARAACLGLTVEEYRDFYNPTHGEIRQLTREEQARQTAISKKIHKVPRKQQEECDRQRTMEEASGMMAGMQKMMESAQKQAAGPSSDMTEAPGKTVQASADPGADLKSGRTVVRDIDWVAGRADVSAAGASSYREAMAKLAPALSSAGGRFVVDFYLDPRYDESAAREVAESRMATLREALPGVQLTLGKVSRDRDTRLELIVAK